MFISDYDLFYRDVKSHWASILKEEIGNPGKNAKDGAKRAYAVYKNTYYASLPFVVLGADRIRSDRLLVGNLGLITADLDRRKRHTVKQIDASILGEQQWSLLINDAFILGAIHEGKEFHLISNNGQFPPIEILWNKELNRMRSLGRELAIIRQAGYQFIHSNNNDEVMLSSCSVNNAPLLLSELQIRLAAIRSLKDFQALLAGSSDNSK